MLSKDSQSAMQQSVKKLLQKCYSTDLSKYIIYCPTTIYERLVHKPLSPQLVS